MLLVATVGLGAADLSEPTFAATSGDTTVETHIYAGTRDIRHVVDAGTTKSRDADYHGVFDVEASRTSKRSGNTVFDTETRFFAARSGGYRSDAAMREVIVRDEHVANGSNDVMLDESEIDRATFGYLAPPPIQGVRGHSPFDDVDRKWIVEKYDTPPLIYTDKTGTFPNVAARSQETSISYELRDFETASIPDTVSSDGTVKGRRQEDIVRESVEQHADGSGHSNSSAAGFYNIDLQIAAATPSRSNGGHSIAVTVMSTGRTVGPNPVITSAFTTPDWYPGVKPSRRTPTL